MQPIEHQRHEYRRKRESSRLSYRLTRLLLAPFTQLMLRWGLPVGFMIVLLSSGALKPDIYQRITHIIDDAYHYISTLPKYQVTKLDIQGATPQTQSDISQALALEFPLSSLHLNIKDVIERTENIPAVKETQIALSQTGVLQINVVERQPALEWHSPKGRFIIDKQGITIRPLQTGHRNTDLPIISGLSANTQTKEALELFYIWNKRQGLPLSLHRIGKRRWNAAPKQGPVIMLPEENPQEALAKVVSLNETKQIFSRSISVIDMRVPERLILRLSPEIRTSSLRIGTQIKNN